MAPRTFRLLLWAAGALGFWLASEALDIRTGVEIYSNGGKVSWSVAGTTLEAPVAISSVRRIEIIAKGAVFPPGGSSLEVLPETGEPERHELQRRFHIPQSGTTPVGDWEVDEGAPVATVFSKPVEVNGPFTVRATFRGRFNSALTVVLVGEPTTAFQVRRGLINNDVFILDEAAVPVATTSIDPRPLPDLAAAAATLLRAAAAACLLLLVFPLLVRVWSRLIPGRWREMTAPRLPAHLQWTAIVCLAVVAASTSAWLATDVLGGLPHQPDSVAYLLQARWLLTGDVYREAPTIAEHLDVPYTRVVENKWVAHYPAGWPLLLAAGVAAGLPWLVAPLLAAAYTILLFLLGRELFGPVVALAATTLAVVSPISTLIFASHLSHAASSTAILLFLWLFRVALRRHTWPPALLAGLAIGYAFGVRPLTAVAVAVVCGVVLLRHRERFPSTRTWWRLTAALVAGGTAATVPTLIHNLLITGNPLAFPYTLTKGAMYAAFKIPFGLRNLDAILASTVPALHGWGWGLTSGWLYLALPLAFAWIPLLRRRPDRRDLLLAALYAAVAAAYLGTQASGLHGFGPRYHFEVFACLYLLTARGFARLSSSSGEGSEKGSNALAGAVPIIALFLILTLSTVLTLPRRFALYRGYNQVTGCLEEQIEAEAIGFGMVLFAEQDWRNWAEAARLMGTDPEHALVFATLRDDNRLLRDYYRDRSTFIWDGEQLRPVDEARAYALEHGISDVDF